MTDLIKPEGLTSRRTLLRAGGATLLGGVSILTLGANSAHAVDYPWVPIRNLYQGIHNSGALYRDQIRMLQDQLNFMRYAAPAIPYLAVDGNFGSGTKAGVIAFQRAWGLKADGIVGPATKEGLDFVWASYYGRQDGKYLFYLANGNFYDEPTVLIPRVESPRTWGM